VTAAARTLEEIHEPLAREWLEERIARPDTLGVLLCGSRANGWAAPDGDYDALVFVAPEAYRSLPVDETLVYLHAPGEMPRRVVGDFSIFSDEHLALHLASPLDVDHWAYLDAVVLFDRRGDLETWRQRIAAFPEAEWKERAIQKYLQILIACSYATKSDVGGREAERQMSLFRGVLAGTQLWFTLRRRWAPPQKWWTREIERLEMRPDTRSVLEGAALNPSVEVLTHLRDHMKTEMRHAGIAEVDAILPAFAATFLPERQQAVYRSLYL
jgi:predicted nucleotidyltransferase